MKRIIYKYDLPDFQNTLQLPVGAQLLSLQIQRECICAWFMIDTEQDALEQRHFHIVGTGAPINNDSLTYLTTVQHGALVWHIFEEIK